MLNAVKHLITYILLFLMPLMTSARTSSVVPDSLQIKALDAKLKEYFKAIEAENLEVQKMECDYIIESAQDLDLRGVIAEKVYDHYQQSPLMGAEGVAVYVFDKWFAGTGLKMSDEIKKLNAQIFADFNRSSLLGCKAPELRMQTMQGDSLTVFPSSDKRYKILYFYDLDCAKCKIQTILVRSLLSRKDYPVDFYPIYVGDKKDQWMKYATDHLNVIAPRTKTTHLWDAEISSDFQRNYGILQTPRLFLVDSNGTIIGRGLNAEALEILLDQELTEKELVYGSEASTKLYDSLFGSIGEKLKTKDVIDFADYIANSTLHNADTVMFRQMTGDLMYYLTMQFKGPYKEGLHYLVNEYILSKPEVWRTQDDSLKVVGMAQAMDDLVSRTQVGTKIPAIETPVTIKTHKKVRSKTVSLDKLKHKKNIIIFYLPSCSNCKEEIAAAEAIISREKSKTALILINMDDVYNDRELSGKLLDSFDLSIIPNILITDKSGKIIERYVSLL